MIFGRKKLIKRLHKTLQSDSILFTGERRVGKTFVLDELVKTAPENTQIIYADLEKITSPLEFVNDILNITQHLFNNKDHTKSWLKKFYGFVSGVEVGGLIKIPKAKEKEWKSLLQTTLNTICNNTDDTIIFLWDEMPYMLQSINVSEVANNPEAKTSLQILDTLRALRKEQSNLRMIFTGSIGLHHVLNEIKGQHLSSQPLNDMSKVGISPLTKGDAKDMIKAHLDAENIEKVSISCMKIIAEACDYIPFYIEKLIRRLSLKEQKITPKIVKNEIEHILTDAMDEWELEHFRSRLTIYYKGIFIDSNQKEIPKAGIAKAILNHCATATTAQSIDNCHQAVKAIYAIEDRDLIIQLLDGLIKDHYLIRDKGNYQFLFTLVQRWWILAEGL